MTIQKAKTIKAKSSVTSGTSFITQLGSESYAQIYDYLELYDNLAKVGMRSSKDDPSEVRALKDKRYDAVGEALIILEDMIVGWLEAVAKQERGLHDIYSLNNKYNNKLVERGIISRVLEHLGEHTTILEKYKDEELIA